jgi:hypothetical protein
MTKLIPKPKILKKPITVEVEQLLLEKVKAQAKSEGLTLRQIVEYGLTRFLEERKK